MTTVQPEDRLEQLYAVHGPRAIGLAYLLTGDREQAEDLVHDAFIRLAGRFAHLRDRAAFPSYLRQTIVNLHLSRLRRLRIERRYVAAGGDHRPLPEDDQALRQDLWTAVQRLPTRQRAAVVLRFYEDLSERQTADVLRCSMPSVKSLVTRGLRALRAHLDREELS